MANNKLVTVDVLQYNNEKIKEQLNEKINIQQDVADANKLLGIGADGKITPVEAPNSVDISSEQGNAIIEKNDGIYVPSVSETKVSAEADNQIISKNDGIYVAPTDLSDYVKTDTVYTKTETDQKIADAVIGGTVDLSSYTTDEELTLALADYTTTVDADEKYVLADDVDVLDKAAIENMIGLSTEELEGLAQIIDDSSIQINKTYSSSKIHHDILKCLVDSKDYTLEQIGLNNTASYKVVSSVDDITEDRYIYLLDNGTNFDMYIVDETGTPVAIGTTDIDLTEYLKTADADDEYVKKTDYEVWEDSIGDVANLTTNDKTVVGAINEIDEMNTNLEDAINAIFRGDTTVGNAEKINGVSVFTAPSQLGITSYHIPDIVRAMPANSIAIFGLIYGQTFTLDEANNNLPTTNGVLEIIKPYDSSYAGRTRILLTSGTNTTKHNVMYICDLNENDWVINGWRCLSDGGDADKLDGLHASDFLPITGGTVGNGTIMSPITFKGKATSAYTKYVNADNTLLGYLGFSAPNKPIYQGDDNIARELLHTGNLVTTIDSTSTDRQIPSAKAMYDTLNESLDIKSITLETTITANPLYCWKSGNVVRIYTAGTITAALTAGTSIEIATLPEEFRPKYTWSKYFTYRITSDMGCVGLIEISTTTGIVTFNPLTVPSTGGVFRLDETFI